jgi:hypothetical protein
MISMITIPLETAQRCAYLHETRLIIDIIVQQEQMSVFFKTEN